MSKHMDEDCAGEPLLSGPDAREMMPADGPFELLDSPRRKKKALQDSLKAEAKQKKRKRYSDDPSDSSSSDSSSDEDDDDDDDDDSDDENMKEAKKEKKEKKEKKSNEDTVGCDWIGRLIRREG